ncbi:hypothetical protein QTP86_031103 [Hemibagrus guttatus]|nr:hypothetical protein QTP86_031103 [Hemibagrus guttatus]
MEGICFIKDSHDDTADETDSADNQEGRWFLKNMKRIPQRATKEKYALGIVTLFPALKDPLSTKGYIVPSAEYEVELNYVFGKEHYYDSHSGSGFLAWWLKTIQRKTKLVSKNSKTHIAQGSGPGRERELPQCGGQLHKERCKEVISLMNHTSDQEIILEKMKETFEYRQHLIHNPDESHTVFCVSKAAGYQRADFSLHFGPETAAKLLEKWHTSYKEKSCRSLEEQLENQEGHRQSYLLTSGTTFYIVLDKKLITCQGTMSLAAFDELFKVHFVFSVSSDTALSNMYTLLQTTINGIDVDTSKVSPKLKELRAKFMNNVEVLYL